MIQALLSPVATHCLGGRKQNWPKSVSVMERNPRSEPWGGDTRSRDTGTTRGRCSQGWHPAGGTRPHGAGCDPALKRLCQALLRRGPYEHSSYFIYSIFF